MPPVPGTDLDDYYQLIDRRFANPKIGDTIRRLCLDGSNRQPKFILPSIARPPGARAERQRARARIGALVPLLRRHRRRRRADRAPGRERGPPQPAARAAEDDPAVFLALHDIFGDIADAPAFRSRFATALQSLWRDGTRATLQRYLNGRHDARTADLKWRATDVSRDRSRHVGRQGHPRRRGRRPRRRGFGALTLLPPAPGGPSRIPTIGGARHRTRCMRAQSRGRSNAVAGIGLSGQMHGAVLARPSDAVLRPAILWNDGRAGAACAELERREPDSRRITGNLAMPGFTAPKLIWVAQHEPEPFRARRGCCCRRTGSGWVDRRSGQRTVRRRGHALARRARRELVARDASRDRARRTAHAAPRRRDQRSPGGSPRRRPKRSD